jgi:hypothetical protein
MTYKTQKQNYEEALLIIVIRSAVL